MCKTSINSKNLQYGDLPPIMLITGKTWKPSEKEFLQWRTSYPDADLPSELRRIEDWFQKHPDRRKTERVYRNMEVFPEKPPQKETKLSAGLHLKSSRSLLFDFVQQRFTKIIISQVCRIEFTNVPLLS